MWQHHDSADVTLKTWTCSRGCFIPSRLYTLMNPVAPLCCCNLIRPSLWHISSGLNALTLCMSEGSEQLRAACILHTFLRACLFTRALFCLGFIPALGAVFAPTVGIPVKEKIAVFFFVWLLLALVMQCWIEVSLRCSVLIGWLNWQTKWLSNSVFL